MTLSYGDRPLEAVVFDLDDVLVPFQTLRAWQWAWRPQGPVLAERHVRTAVRRALRAWDRRRWQGLTGRAPPADLAALKEHLAATLRGVAGHAVAPDESEAVVRRFLRPSGEVERFPDAAPALARLEGLGVKVAVVTPLPDESARWLLKRAGLPESALALAGDPPGPVVPDRAAFRLVLERLRVPASRAGFVGDLYWSDVHAAHRVGLASVLLDRTDAWPKVQAGRLTTLDALEATLASNEVGAAPEGAAAETPPGPPASGDPL